MPLQTGRDTRIVIPAHVAHDVKCEMEKVSVVTVLPPASIKGRLGEIPGVSLELETAPDYDLPASPLK